MAISLSVEGTTCSAVKGTNGRGTISRIRVRVRHGTLPERELVQRRSEPEGNFHIAAVPGTEALLCSYHYNSHNSGSQTGA